MTTNNPATTRQAESMAHIGARLERLHGIPLSATTLIILAVTYFLGYYDITVIGVALPSIAKDMSLSEAELGLPVTVNLFGYVVGAYCFGNIADYVGRKKGLAGALAVMSVGALLTAFSINLAWLSIFRFVVGLGTGALISLGATYATEVTPPAWRGKFTQINSIFGSIGLAVTPWIGVLLLGVPTTGWRILLGIGALSVVPLLLLRWFPESPRWLASVGRTQEADTLTSSMEQRVRRRRGGATLPAVTDAPREQTDAGFPTKTLLRQPYLSRLVIVLIFWVAWYICVYGMLGFEPTLLKSIGFSESHSILFTALGDIAFPLGPAVALLIIDRVERKWITAGSAVFMAAGMILLATAQDVSMVIAGAAMFAFVISLGTAAGSTYTTEVFPTNARASAMSIGDGIGHLGGVAAPAIVVAALAAWGGSATFWTLASIVLVGALVIGIGGRRTTGMALTGAASKRP